MYVYSFKFYIFTLIQTHICKWTSLRTQFGIYNSQTAPLESPCFLVTSMISIARLCCGFWTLSSTKYIWVYTYIYIYIYIYTYIYMYIYIYTYTWIYLIIDIPTQRFGSRASPCFNKNLACCQWASSLKSFRWRQRLRVRRFFWSNKGHWQRIGKLGFNHQTRDHEILTQK